MKKFTLFINIILPLLIFPQQNITPEIQQYINNEYYNEIARPAEKNLMATASRELLEKLGDAYGRWKQWNKAAKCYGKLAKDHPGVADYHYKYGGVIGMMALENKLKAIGLIGDIKKAFKKAAHLDPQHKAVRWALVELYMQLPGILGGSRKKALHYAEELEKLSKVEGFLAKGYIYEYDNKLAAAEKYYASALQNLDHLKKVSGNHLHYKIGKLCGDHNTKLDKGLYHLQEYIYHYTSQDAIKLQMVYCNIARIYRYKKEKEKAMTWIRKALGKNADFKEALKEKALIEAL